MLKQIESTLQRGRDKKASQLRTEVRSFGATSRLFTDLDAPAIKNFHLLWILHRRFTDSKGPMDSDRFTDLVYELKRLFPNGNDPTKFYFQLLIFQR